MLELEFSVWVLGGKSGSGWVISSYDRKLVKWNVSRKL